ncbi:endonuclease [Mesorhizobium sp. Root157]|uniref:endonuclease/exonuclease/phosphatase family protein n=1 Tax=Mesorhizobium sp. Root157 TaxID=1736477 RepID=UPI0006FB6C2D|nr:endonuclease/exonuclease/phosphatase family protein [Mesorhizobium sp. Root157]KQZ80910.1 endonuclease [Mesorhizobium sp. Root157]
MKLVTYNVQFGVGRDDKVGLERIAESVAGADIIALQEVTRNYPTNGGIDMVAGLTALLPNHFHVYGAAMDIDFGALVPNPPKPALRFQFGNMLFSRWPIASSRNLLLPRSRTYDKANLQRAALEGLIVTPLGPLRVYSVHLDHVNPQERVMQVRHLKERAFAYPMEGGSITGAGEYGFPEPPCPEDFILMGDFNMRPGEPEYAEMTGAPDPLFGRRIVAHHPVDASRLAGPPPEGSVSWTDLSGAGKHSRLDYCFVSAGLARNVKECWIDNDADGSDHQPVWTVLE